MKHGLSNTKIYGVWRGIQDRIYNNNTKTYKNYGGRGIKCLWNNFEDFYKDMGSSYKEGLTIDRKENDGNYCKSNCRWITQKENNRNRRDNIRYNGVLLLDLCIKEGIEYNNVYYRINHGRTIEEALGYKEKIKDLSNYKKEGKIVAKIDSDGNIIKKYNSLLEASKIEGIPRKGIMCVCRGDFKQTHGMKFIFLN